MRDLTNEEFLKLWDQQLRRMSYYNAAEGRSYSTETAARNQCSATLKGIEEEALERGLERPSGNYLC